MRNSKLLMFFIFALSTAGCFAQKSNAEKIIGCWVLKKIEFTTKDYYSDTLIETAKNTVVCFTTDGKFTTTMPKKGSDTITGTYKISADGKTISQKGDWAEEDDIVRVENDAVIELLDDHHLVIKVESTTSYFERQ